MATETLRPYTTLLLQTNLSGAYTDIDDDPDSPDGSWLTAVSTSTDCVLHVSFQSPSGNLTTGAGLQEFRVLYRNNPTGRSADNLSIYLYENGSQVGSVLLSQADPADSTVYSGTWNASALSDVSGANVECYITITADVSPAPQIASGDIGAVEWNVDYLVPVDITVPQGNIATTVFSPTVTIGATSNPVDITVPQGNLDTTSTAPALFIHDNPSFDIDDFWTGAFSPDAFDLEASHIAIPQESLQLSGFSPAISIAAPGNDIAIAIPVVDIGITVFAPTLTITGHVPVIVPHRGLVTSTVTPIVYVTSHIPITIPQGNLTTTVFAPAINITEDIPVTVPQANLQISSSAPNLLLTEDVTISISSGALQFSASAPVINVSGDTVVSVPSATLQISSDASIIDVTEYISITVPQGNIGTTTFAPSTVISASGVIQVPSGSLSFVSTSPNILNAIISFDSQSFDDHAFHVEAFALLSADDVSIRPPQGILAFNAIVDPETGDVITDPETGAPITDYDNYIPSIGFTERGYMEVPATNIAITGYAPVIGGDHVVIVPTTSLSITSNRPTVNGAEAANSWFNKIWWRRPWWGEDQWWPKSEEVPGAAQLSITTFAPGISFIIRVPVANLDITEKVPVVSNQQHWIRIPVTTASLNLSGSSPVVGHDYEITVPAASLDIATVIPKVGHGHDFYVPITSLNISTTAPVITVSDNIYTEVPSGSATISSVAPAMEFTNSYLIRVPANDTRFSTKRPNLVWRNNILIPDNDNLQVSTTAPTVVAPQPSVAIPGGGYLWNYRPLKDVVLPRRKKKQAVEKRLAEYVRSRLEFRPVDVNLEKLNRIIRTIEEILLKKYELDELYKMAILANRLEKDGEVAYEDIDVLEDVNKDLIPIAEDVINVTTRPPWNSKYNEIIDFIVQQEANDLVEMTKIVENIESIMKRKDKSDRFDKRIAALIRKYNDAA